MPKFYWFSAGFGTISVFISIFLHYYIYSFLSNSALLSFDNSLILINLFSLFFSILFTSFLFVFSNKTNKQILILYSFLAAIFSFFKFYFGFKLFFNPSIYLSNLNDEWKNQLDSQSTEIIQNKYKCCGFYKVNELPKDECVFKKPNSCLFSMSKHLGSTISRIGIFIMLNSVLFILASLFLSIEYNYYDDYNDGLISL